MTEIEDFDERVQLLAQPVERIPLTADEERRLTADLDEYDRVRRRGEWGLL